MSTMRAVQVTGYHQNLQLAELPVPTPTGPCVAEFCGPLIHALGGGAQHHPAALRDELACNRRADAARRSGAGHDRHPLPKARHGSRSIQGRLGGCRVDRPPRCGFQCIDTQFTAVDTKGAQTRSLSPWRLSIAARLPTG